MHLGSTGGMTPCIHRITVFSIVFQKENRSSVSKINGIFSITIQQQKANGNKSDWKKKKKVGGELYGVLQKWLL